MTERIPLTKLNGQKIYRDVVKGNMTLMQLAEYYECSWKQFFAECKKLVGKEEWPRIERADKRNQKKPSRKDDTSMAKPEKNKNGFEFKKQTIRDEMETVEEKLGISQSVLQDFTQRLERAKADETTAQRLYEEAVNRRKWAEDSKEKAEKQVKNYQNRIFQLQNRLAELDVYLVAPGYKGQIPKGRIIAVDLITGYDVTLEKGDELLNDVTFAEVMRLGFETFKEADRALEFAKLVLKYQLEYEEEYHILVDDEKIIKILHGQEVDI